MQTNLGKKILLEFIDFIKYKIDNDLLTMQEMDSMAKAIENNFELLGTADDFAKFYNQPLTNVSSVINRRMFEKPLRKVFYRFNTFRKITPEKWRSHTE